MVKNAYAKINLTLDITGLLPDGYHSLFTVMTAVGCFDIISVNPRADEKIVLTADKDYIPLDEKNTCHKAAELFYSLTGIRGGCDIDIQNRVPSGAGLGNSSADAAAVLKALNELYSRPLTDAALCRQSVRVGADVPFCFAGGTKLCLGTGDDMSDLPAFDYPVLIVKAPVSFPTAGAYARYDALEKEKNIVHPDNENFLSFAKAGDWKNALKYAGNVFEQIQPAQPVADIRKDLYSGGAFYAAMSGSGSAVFGVFEKGYPRGELEASARIFRDKGYFAFVSEGDGHEKQPNKKDLE